MWWPRGGDPAAEEITNSVTKSFLSTVVGLAVDDGRIRSVRDTVAAYVPPIVRARPNGTAYARDWPGTDKLLMPFDTPHNRTITWDDLLRQVSDWEGTLWGKPEWADRPAQDANTWTTRARVKPGSTYEYNDTRVNVLALAALQVWRRPLPEVLKERVMDPIGASNTWRWYGYDNSWIVLDGREVQSVSGGGHWGGGMVLNAWDMARFGLLTLRRGNWGRQAAPQRCLGNAGAHAHAGATHVRLHELVREPGTVVSQGGAGAGLRARGGRQQLHLRGPDQ